MDINTSSFLPTPPIISDEVLLQCKKSGDFRPILFELYKYGGILCNTAACISTESPAFRGIPEVHYAILIGLLNRCSRLMLANVRLSCTKRYGETTKIIDRSITESSIIVQWLCLKDNRDSFQRYLADGLKKDLILKEQIEKNIYDRDGKILNIESRMLKSIQKCISLSGISAQQVIDTKKLPDFATMCNDLNLIDLFYTGIQRMGSHAVHGTWSELIINYLNHEDNRGFFPRDHEIDTQDVQFIVVLRIVLEAIRQFLKYVVADTSDVREFNSIIDNLENKIIEIQELAWAADSSKE